MKKMIQNYKANKKISLNRNRLKQRNKVETRQKM